MKPISQCVKQKNGYQYRLSTWNDDTGTWHTLDIQDSDGSWQPVNVDGMYEFQLAELEELFAEEIERSLKCP